VESNDTSFNVRPVLTLVDDPPNGSPAFGGQPALKRVRDVVAGSEAALARAGEAVANVQREIGHLWRDSMTADDRAMSQRYAEVSHALQRAALLLECDDAIG